MIRVGVLGAGGRMGATVCEAVHGDDDLSLVAAVDPSYSGLDLRTVTGVDAGIRIASGPAALERGAVQVVVDFSHRAAAMDNLRWCAEHGVHAVVGTTGFTDDDMAAFDAMFTLQLRHRAQLRDRCSPDDAPGGGPVLRLEIVELHHEQARCPVSTNGAHRPADGRGVQGHGPRTPPPRS